MIYSTLTAEFFSTINALLPIEADSKDLFMVILHANYILTILFGFVVWLITAFTFYLTAMLFNGQGIFKQFLHASAYPYIVAIIGVVIALSLCDNIDTANHTYTLEELSHNHTLKLAMEIVNYSFIPYYAMIAALIHYILHINYLRAILSVAIPILSVWGVTELIKAL